MTVAQELKKRNLPDILTMNNGEKVTPETWEARRKELLDCLSQNLYGYTPPAPEEVRATYIGSDRTHCFGGKARHERYNLSFDTPGGEFTFPVWLTIPVNVEKPPVILQINFLKDPCSLPQEEILDNGFALVQFDYNDIQPELDDKENYFGNFTHGLGAMYIGDRKREKNEWGKVGMWAFGASRVMDYLQTRDDINTQRIAVTGHSRLGKTALWCKAQDPRFFLALGNNTNYGGGGIIRGHIGEDLPLFLEYGSFDFFCEGWKDFENVPHEDLPFDQHFLMACHAPGLVYLDGATKDHGMDPVSEFLSCVAASEVYEMLGLQGLERKDEMPAVGEALLEGNIGFHVREGTHYFSREDWQHFMDFFKKHM